MSKMKRNFVLLMSVLFAVMVAVGTFFAVGTLDFSKKAQADNDRVQVSELYDRYGADYVIGPLAEKDENGNYPADLLDFYDRPTNNVYKIPADRYFNADNYLHIDEVNTTVDGVAVTERVLRGWKNGIAIVDPADSSVYINEDGYITSSATDVATSELGMYFKYTNTSEKYILIVPNKVTQIGLGNAAFNAAGAFTDFGYYNYSWAMNAELSKTNNYWSPRERLLGVYFNNDSLLTKFQNSSVDSGGGNVDTAKETGKAAFASCNNIRFFVLPNNGILTDIGDRAFYYCQAMTDVNIPTSVTRLGTRAFGACSNLPHLSIPSSVETVGQNVFLNAMKLADVENNTSALKKANFPAPLNYYTSNSSAVTDADGSGTSKLFVIGNSAKDNGKEGFYFVKNHANTAYGYRGTLATVSSGGNELYAGGQWYAIGLAGRQDTKGEIKYRLPATVSGNNDERRKGIAYDYLDNSGGKHTNQFATGETIERYDIGKNMVSETWCRNIALPGTVNIVGDTAFFFSHLQYLETSATILGKQAFYRNTKTTFTSDHSQYYYIHKAIVKYGTDVFSAISKDNEESNLSTTGDKTLQRRYIFENHALYTTYKDDVAGFKNLFAYTSANKFTPTSYYQIPIIANVKSADGNVEIVESDRDPAFMYDADYVDGWRTAPEGNGDGTYSIVYTKRLSGYAYSYVKQPDGSWSTAGNKATATIKDMESTVWYASDDVWNPSVWNSPLTAPTPTTPAALYSSSAQSLNIYTKKVARPVIDGNRQPYEFGVDVGEGQDETIAFIDSLGLEKQNADYKGDYTVSLVKFRYPSDNAPSTNPNVIRNAGTYELRVDLSESRWGKWEADYALSDRSGTTTVIRQVIDLGDFANLPQFVVNDAMNTPLGGSGLGSTLYRYAEGWFLYRQSQYGSEIDTQTVNNAYTRYLNDNITIKSDEHFNLYNVVQGRGTHTAKDSGQYFAYFNLRVKKIGDSDETNYEFSLESVSENEELFNLYGIAFDDAKKTEVELRKCWYIVMQSNWFIDSAATLDPANPYAASPFVLAKKDGVSVRDWTYEDEVDVFLPKLAYADSYDKATGLVAQTVRPTITISYTNGGVTKELGTLTLTDSSTVADLRYYFNAAMPAGTYTLVISAGEVVYKESEAGGTAIYGTYPEIRDTITVEVLPKRLDTDAIYNKINEKEYTFAYDGSVHVHGDISEEQTALNNSLNAKYKAAQTAGDNNYWLTVTFADYYESKAEIAYNLNRWGNTNYITGDGLPNGIDKYTVYYSIAAKNYLTFGGADDEARRDKFFTTIICAELSVKNSLLDANNLFFQNVTYTGSVVQTLVPYSQYFNYSFDDVINVEIGGESVNIAYIDVRERASVTLRLNNPALARWNLDVSGGRFAFAEDEDGNPIESVLVAYFDILPAQNAWNVAPFMPSWTFDGFDGDVNVITSGLKFEGAEVTYYVGLDATAALDSGKWTQINESNEEVLKRLTPGNYYLLSVVGDLASRHADGEGNAYVNVQGGRFIAGTRIEAGSSYLATVNIAKASNRWTTSPNVVRWNWSEFNKEIHKISGTPRYLNLADKNVENQVKFTVLDSAKKAIGGLIGFTLDENGLVSEAVKAELAKLGANNYYLLAIVEGTAYYTGLNELPAGLTVAAGTDLGKSEYGLDLIPFDVMQFVNYWETSPSMTGWQYDTFTEDTNFVAGKPKHPAQNAVVTYYFFESGSIPTATAGGYDLTKATKTFTAIDATLATYFRGLSVGDYSLIAKAEGTNDYSVLETPIYFSIGTNQTNGWSTIPSITGWIYGASSADNLTKGVAMYGTVTYTISRNNVDLIGFVGLTFDELKDSIALLNADTYQLTVVSAQEGLAEGQTANYVSAIRTLMFVVEKAENEWAEDETPSITGWIWGAYDEEVNAPYHGVTAHEYDENKIHGEYWVTNSEGRLLSLVKEPGGVEGGVPTLAGLYAYVVTADETTNYNKLSANVYFEIKQATNTWSVKPETAISWTWGDTLKDATAEDSFALVRAAAAYGNVRFTIEGNKANGDSVSRTATAQTIKTVLQSLGAGTYNVVTSVDNDDSRYTGIDTPTSISVGKGTLAWKEGTAPADLSWKWDALTKTFVAPVAVGTEQGEEIIVSIEYKVTYTPFVGSVSTTTLTDAALLKQLLTVNGESTGHAGVYAIEITATNENYNTFTDTMTVTVERATNVWTGSQPSDTSGFYKEFNAGNFPTLGSSSGATVRYELRTEGSKQEIINLVNWANGLSAAKYTVYAVVDATNDYSPLEKAITVEVKQSSRNWTNSDYDTNKTATFGETFGVIVPYMDPIPEADKDGKVTYSVTYARIGSSDFHAVTIENLSVTALNDYFKQIRDAGTYKITAKYDSGDINVQSPEHTLTVTIRKVDVSFGSTQPSTTVSFSYQGANLTIPNAGLDYQGNAHVITYSVVGENGVTHTPAVGANLNEFLNTLSVGTYTLTTSVALDDPNYNGKSVVTTVLVTKAPNGWVSGHAPSNKSIVRGGTIANFVEPKAQRGNENLTITISGGSLAQSVQQSASGLKSYLESLSEGTYTITYYVPDDIDDNYDGFTVETQFTVSLQANGWGTTLNQTYSLTWSPDGIKGIPTPTATNKASQPVLFEITSADGTTVLSDRSSVSAFEAWLKEAKAGTYSVNYYVEASVDVAGIDRATSTITIAKKANAVTLTPSTSVNWVYGGAENVLPTLNAEYLPTEASGIVYYINGVQLEGSLRNALNALPVGEYTLRAEITESTNYLTGYADVKVVVVQGANGWEEEYVFAIVESEKTTEAGKQTYLGWQWDLSDRIPQTVLSNAPKALRGSSVNLTVSKINGTQKTVVDELRLTYTVHDNGSVTSNLNEINAYLRTLNAGKYEIKAEIPASANWSITGVSAKTVEFEVLKNQNAWIGGNPTIQDWTYGSSRNLPTVGGVKYGSVQDIRYTYYFGGKEVNDFNAAGSYTFKAEIAASPEGNYDALVYEGTFNIAKLKGNWQTVPGITGWTWNEFNETVNLFVGAAVSGGEVVFKIIDAKGTVVVDGLKPDENGVITDAQKLAILKNQNVMLAGNYTFEASVAATDNYQAETQTGSFRVAQAQNRWLTYPTITMWAENLWKSGENLPSAKSRYGNITLTIRKVGEDGNVIEGRDGLYYEATYTKDGVLIKEEVSRLANAVGGKYLLTGKVEAVATQYEGLDDSFAMEIFLSSSTRPTNHWITYPSINDWTAGETPSAIGYLAYRFKDTTITFYYAVKDENGDVVKDENGYAVLGDEVPSDELDGNGYPTHPGDYVMNVISKYTDSDCTDDSGYYPYDTLDAKVSFKIKKRIIEWTIAPNITDWLLSEEASVPVAAFNFMNEEGSTLTIQYRQTKNANGEPVEGNLLNELPPITSEYDIAGEYEMIVTATAKYCDSVEARIAFKVSYAKNTWTDIPVIDGWSAEDLPNDPLGKAENGEVTYVYKTLDGEILPEKPTEEGTYILCATVKLAGYETLYSEYEFTISPIFNITLLAVDISLACVLSALTVVVIVFAIRRYRENG